MSINLSDKIIKQNLEFLRSHLPPNPTAVEGFFQLPRQYKKYLRNNYSQPLLQQIADHIGNALGVVSKVKVTLIDGTSDPRWVASNAGVVFTSSTGANYSGLYRTLGYDHNEILLVKKFKYQLKNILAILAHESVHHYLSYYGVRKNKEDENEILTDVATAYLGLGQLLVDGYKPIVWTSDYYNYVMVSGHTTHTATIGYVTPDTIKRAIYLSAELRKWNPSEVVNSFSSFADRFTAFFVLWPYRNEVNKMRRRAKKVKMAETKSRAKVVATKKSLQGLKESFQKVASDFERFSKTPNISKVSPEEGSKFIELANEISLGSVDQEIGALFKEENLNTGIDYLSKINVIKKRLNNWQKLLDKYQVL